MHEVDGSNPHTAYGHAVTFGHPPAYGHLVAYGHPSAYAHALAYGHLSTYGHPSAYAHPSAYGATPARRHEMVYLRGVCQFLENAGCGQCWGKGSLIMLTSTTAFRNRRWVRPAPLLLMAPGRSVARVWGQEPLWRQPRGKSIVSSVNSHTNATRTGCHLWEIRLKICPWVASRVGWERTLSPSLPLRNRTSPVPRSFHSFVGSLNRKIFVRLSASRVLRHTDAGVGHIRARVDTHIRVSDTPIRVLDTPT